MFQNKKYFAKGKHSVVYTALYRNKKVAIKVESLPKRAEKEAYYLKVLNKHNIGPKLLLHKKNFIVYEFVEGLPILEWVKQHRKNQIVSCIIRILKLCRTMDKLRINKKELHNPYKHILVKGSKPVMIDFERCHKTEKPKNITQFIQFLMSKRLSLLLKEKGIRLDRKELIKMAGVYKDSYSEKDCMLIERYLRKV